MCIGWFCVAHVHKVVCVARVHKVVCVARVHKLVCIAHVHKVVCVASFSVYTVLIFYLYHDHRVSNAIGRR